jgi:hypothetical protein
MTDRTLAVYEKALRRRSGQTGPSG